MRIVDRLDRRTRRPRWAARASVRRTAPSPGATWRRVHSLALEAAAGVDVVGAPCAGRSAREAATVSACSSLLIHSPCDREAGAEAVAGDARLRVREAAEGALELVAHRGPHAVEAAPRVRQRRGDRDAGQDPGQDHAGPGEDDARAHDRGRHLEVLVHPPPLPAVLAVDERGAQPEEQRGDHEQEQVAEQVGEGGRQVDDQRGAEERDCVDHAVVAIDGVRGHERGRPHQRAEADGVRRQLHRIAGPEHRDRPAHDVVAQRLEAADLVERGVVLAADGPQDHGRAEHGAQRQGDRPR